LFGECYGGQAGRGWVRKPVAAVNMPSNDWNLESEIRLAWVAARSNQ
jgi:hypothetical protein